MKDKALEFLKQLRTLWESLSRARRIALGGLMSVVLIGAIATSVLASRVRYTYLYSDLSQEDASAIVAKLGELKVPHRVEGTAIQVPEERVHEVRLQLAGAGLPRGGGVGFELFDKSQFGATEFEQQINLRRALEGELSRTIGSIEAVRSARVHLVLPERSVFAVRNQAGSASVVLHLRPGRPFGRKEVASVVHLVASAAPGLSPERVSVVGADGTMLHRPTGEGAAAGAGADGFGDADLERATALEVRVRELLERVVGPGHADVRVQLAIDPSTRERTEERFDPKTTALRSEHELREGPGADGEGPSGIPGAQSNLPEGANAADFAEARADGPDAATPEESSWDVEPGSSAAGLHRRSRTRNFEVSRVMEKTTTPAGGLRSLSVAVLVDGVHESVDGVPKYRQRTPEELATLTALVKGVVGFDGARGDTLQIESTRFFSEPPPAEPAAPTPLLPGWYRWYYGAAAGGVLLAAALVGIALLLRRARRTSQVRTATLLATAAEEPVARMGEGAAQAPGLPAPRLGDPERLRAEAVELVLQDPDTASVILREWLNAGPAPRVPSPTGMPNATSA